MPFFRFFFIATIPFYCTSRPVAQAYLKVQRLLDEYISQHSTLNFHNAVDICSRKFLVATYDFPEQMGSRLNSFINGFIVAIITNRTLLWEKGQGRSMHLSGQPYNGRNIHFNDSSDHITFLRKDWLSRSGYEIAKILDTAGCPIHTEVPHVIVDDRFHKSIVHRIACCGLDQISDRIIGFGELETHEVNFLFVLSFYSILMNFYLC